MTITLNRAKFRALRNMTRAIARGDFDAALNWSLIFDGQLLIAKRFSDLERRRPRRKPRQPTPKPAVAAEAPPQPSEKPPEKPYVGAEILDAPLSDPLPPGPGPRTWREFFHPEPWMFDENRGPPAQFSERGRAGLLKPLPLDFFSKPSSR